MRPIQLTMQAFGSYGQKTVIDFTKPNQNLFLITGDTGAGKTTIFDAMVYAIYGESSSDSNPKSGMILQSQFASPEVSPFVELVFSERQGENENIYTVRRVPKHVRLKKTGTGTTAGTESVSLTMPDGTEFSGKLKETNEKLIEIAGLTKAQFMQVGMIAQGEFMQLLRADSDNKKQIFTRLFKTGIYGDIIEELRQRYTSMGADIARIHTACQQEVSHLKVPEDYEKSAEMQSLKKDICAAKTMNVAEMEVLMQQIGTLCGILKEKQTAAVQKEKETRKSRDREQTALTQGQELQKAFDQLNHAQKELDDCSKAEPDMKDAEALITAIRTSYDIQAVWNLYQASVKECTDMETSLAAEQKKLPALTEAAARTAAAEQQDKAALDQELEEYSKIETRANQALKAFRQIRSAKAELDNCVRAEEEASTRQTGAEQQLAAFSSQEAKWKEQRAELEGSAAQLADCRNEIKAADRSREQIKEAELLDKEVLDLIHKAEKAQTDYAFASRKYSLKNEEYNRKQTLFLDAQAGFLAKEKLIEGQPCPVCGSIHHPNPCMLKEGAGDLTRETIDQLRSETEDLRQKWTTSSAEAETARKNYQNRNADLEKMLGQLHAHLLEQVPEYQEAILARQQSGRSGAFSMILAKRSMDERYAALKTQEALLKKQTDAYNKICENLQKADAQRTRLETTRDKARQDTADAKAATASARSGLATLQQNLTYASEETARAELRTAAQQKAKQQSVYEQSKTAAENAHAASSRSEALINRYESELPGKKANEEKLRKNYAAVMEEKDLAESEWQQIVYRHPKKDASALQKQLDDYKRRKSTAEGALSGAQKLIGKQDQPDLQQLKAKADEADKQWKDAQTVLSQIRSLYTTDSELYRNLSAQMETSAKKRRDYALVEQMYRRLSGKLTGRRMDLETYVQRYYLQRILHAANKRFLEMSAGQYELRMIDEEMAGEGKNHGLDLMVYSAVTGRIREVRTLSGGESFMAALSLALGMADQIQAGSASINLDVMFIDEGFGSLDEHSRNQAVRVLQQMAGGSRMIGIISHVSELKQEIEDQLIVTKADDGSHVKWQIS